jgi:hypothetical protein
MTGANPAHDTRLSLSNRTAARDHLCNNLTESAFPSARQPSLDNSDYRRSEGTFTNHTPPPNANSSVEPG